MRLNKIPGQSRISPPSSNSYRKAKSSFLEAPELFLPFPALPSRWPQSLGPQQPRRVRRLQCAPAAARGRTPRGDFCAMWSLAPSGAGLR